MNIGELKQYVARFPKDMDGLPAIIISNENGTLMFNDLAFVGFVPLDGAECFDVGDLPAVSILMKNGQAQFLKEKENNEGEEWKQG